MAAQIALRLLAEDPFATPQELPIKFLVLINSAVPPCIMPLEVAGAGAQKPTEIPIEDAPTFQMLFGIFKADPSDWKDKARPAVLPSGRQVLANDTHTMAFYDARWDGQCLTLPSLHVTGQGDHPAYGQHLYELADPAAAMHIGHVFGHDFPRGLDMNKDIARAIRALAEKAL